MKKLIDRMNTLANGLERLYRDTLEHEEEYAPGKYIKVGESLEKVNDLLQGFLTGNFEDYEIDDAQKLLKYWGF